MIDEMRCNPAIDVVLCNMRSMGERISPKWRVYLGELSRNINEATIVRRDIDDVRKIRV
jgi:hypothetical protein